LGGKNYESTMKDVRQLVRWGNTASCGTPKHVLRLLVFTPSMPSKQIPRCCVWIRGTLFCFVLRLWTRTEVLALFCVTDVVQLGYCNNIRHMTLHWTAAVAVLDVTVYCIAGLLETVMFWRNMTGCLRCWMKI
jgi:hypothetical protein